MRIKPCRYRLEWIDHALRAIDEEFRVWQLEYDPHPLTIEYYPEADVHVFRLGDEPLPARYGVITGNIIHQIRATLDNLVWHVVIANGKEPTGGTGGNQFPIFTEPSKGNAPFAQRVTNTLRGFKPDQVAFVERLQPYTNPGWGAGHPLAVLADLNNADKHQVLQVLAAAEPFAPPRAIPEFVEGKTIDSVTDVWWAPFQLRYPGAIVGCAHLLPSGFHPDVKVHGSYWSVLSLPGTGQIMMLLDALYAVVEAIVNEFEVSLFEQRPIPSHVRLDRDTARRWYIASQQLRGFMPRDD